MKQFSSLIEGINYHNNCPICNAKLDISDDKHQALMLDIPIYNHAQEQVLICYELIDGDLVIIEKYTGKINFIIRNNLNYNYHTNSFPIILECSNRSKNRCFFSYELLCRLDSYKHELYDICLLSEQFSFENTKKELCVIKNVYQEEIAYYTQDIFSFPNLDGKRIKLPLLDVDFKKLSMLIKKIEHYLIFS